MIFSLLYVETIPEMCEMQIGLFKVFLPLLAHGHMVFQELSVEEKVAALSLWYSTLN